VQAPINPPLLKESYLISSQPSDAQPPVLAVDCGRLKLFINADCTGRKILGVKINLHVASQSGKLLRVKKLLRRGADINSKDEKGFTPLHLAAFYGHKQVLEFLIDNGAEINSRDKEGYTPLHLAAQIGDPEIVELLILDVQVFGFLAPEGHPDNSPAIYRWDRGTGNDRVP